MQEKSDSELDDNENIYDNKLSRTEEVVREDIKDFQVNTKWSIIFYQKIFTVKPAKHFC